MKRSKYFIILIVITACIIMGFVDAVIKPGYMIKSLIKISLFLIPPIIYAHFNKDCNLKKLFIPNKEGIKIALILGVSIYIFIVLGYVIVEDIFDFSAITGNLSETMGINKLNFIWVALYISFINSLLEEFFFRGFAFISLKEVSSRNLAFIFSAIMFSIYHVSMMIGWFHIGLVLLTILALFIGGAIFNLVNEKYDNIYISWLVHMFANFAINTVGLMLFGIL